MTGSGGRRRRLPRRGERVGSSQYSLVLGARRAETVRSSQGLKRSALHAGTQGQIQEGDASQGVEVRHSEIADPGAAKS